MCSDNDVNKKVDELAAIIQKKRDGSKPYSDDKRYYRKLSERVDHLKKCIESEDKTKKEDGK
jgi:hypothetical protein